MTGDDIRTERRFEIPKWDDAMRQKAMDYWSRRGVSFFEVTESTLAGKRGNILGNLLSFDMSNLLAILYIGVSLKNEIHCVLDVDTVLQHVTEYNRAWWNLELETFESFLLRNDEQTAKWQVFLQSHYSASLAWTFSLGMLGNRMQPAERYWLSSTTADKGDCK
jgi:hypothetical protein